MYGLRHGLLYKYDITEYNLSVLPFDDIKYFFSITGLFTVTLQYPVTSFTKEAFDLIMENPTGDQMMSDIIAKVPIRQYAMYTKVIPESTQRLHNVYDFRLC